MSNMPYLYIETALNLNDHTRRETVFIKGYDRDGRVQELAMTREQFIDIAWQFKGKPRLERET